VIDPDWRKYPETILRFLTQPPGSVDLRLEVTDAQREIIERAGLSGSFAVITPCDPLGRDLSPEENRALMKDFLHALRDDGEYFVRVDACSPDGSHCEPSVALKTDLDRARTIAREREQMAFFWYDGKAFWIIAALVSSEPIPLPPSS
jgi:hypothetical protein